MWFVYSVLLVAGRWRRHAGSDVSHARSLSAGACTGRVQLCNWWGTGEVTKIPNDNSPRSGWSAFQKPTNSIVRQRCARRAVCSMFCILIFLKYLTNIIIIIPTTFILRCIFGLCVCAGNTQLVVDGFWWDLQTLCVELFIILNNNSRLL